MLKIPLLIQKLGFKEFFVIVEAESSPVALTRKGVNEIHPNI